MSHTYAVLDVSPEAYQEIRKKLLEAGYDHAIEGDDAGEVIDMHGIALSEEEPKSVTSRRPSFLGCLARGRYSLPRFWR